MSNHFVTEDRIQINDKKNESKPNVDVKWSTLSERTITDIRTIFRKIRSEPQIESNVNYDDLCGPWIYLKNPLYNHYVDSPSPTLCIWKYFTQEDIIYLKKHQENKNMICALFENKMLNGKNDTIFVHVLWEFFKFARLNSFTEKSISACLGIVCLTHLFFLSYPYWTAQEIHRFFYKTVLLHVVLVCMLCYQIV